MKCPKCNVTVAGVYEPGSYSCSGCGVGIQVNPSKTSDYPEYRKFNGEYYELLLSGLSKDEANRQAVSNRKGGRKARVVRGGPFSIRSGRGYALWVGTGARVNPGPATYTMPRSIAGLFGPLPNPEPATVQIIDESEDDTPQKKTQAVLDKLEQEVQKNKLDNLLV